MRIGARELAVILPRPREGRGPLYRQLATGLGDAIRRGDVAPGTILPSERLLADELGISRTTVVTAYRELQQLGSVDRREGSGTRVAATRGRVVGVVNPRTRLASRFIYGPHDAIDLATIELQPLLRVAETAAAIGAAEYRALLATGSDDLLGLHELRLAIAERTSRDGLRTVDSEVLVTAGGQQAIELIAEGCVQPGDTVLIATPTYRGALSAFTRAGCRVRSVPSDDESGISLSHLERLVTATSPRLLYLQSHIANPTGGSLNAANRQRVREIAAVSGMLLVDDRCLADTSFVPIPPPFADITIGSMDKLFWSGLRIGWIRAPADVIDRLAHRAGVTSAGASMPAAFLCARLLDDLESARRERRAELEAEYERAAALLSNALPEWSWSRPRGGPGIWAALPRGTASEYAARALELGVTVLPERVFTTDPKLDQHVRIVFAHPEERMAAGIGRLADAWSRFDPRAKTRANRPARA